MNKFEAINLDGSDVLFSMRQFDPPVSPVYDKIGAESLTGAEIIQQVLSSPRIKNAVTEIADKQGETVEVVLKEVKNALEDIGHTFTLKSVRFVGYLLRKVFRNIYEGIKVNMAGLEKVKELAGEVPVVLVPSHRSYTDFLLVSFVCFIFQLPLPVIAAAQDFKNMTLIGGLLRNCGAFYMKRSFRSDELYWTVFYEYVQCLVLNSGTTMEFFLEGTRSRSGKSLHPKQGLLSILTDLYLTSRVPDVVFCPISISYERVLEEKLLARELLGIPKPKESFTGLLNSHSVLSENYGYAYLHFGKPISFREFSDGKVNRVKRSCIPRSLRNDPSQDEMVIVRELANHILNKIQDHLIILPNMVVASILLQNPRGMDLEMLINQYVIFLGWCKTCSVPITGKDGQDSRDAVLESIQLLRSSLTLTENNTVCLLDPEQFPEQFKTKLYALVKGTYFHRWELDKTNDAENLSRADNSFDKQHSRNLNEKENGSCSREDILNKCEISALRTEEKEYVIHLTCVHLQLAHQRNQLLHWFYVPAMAVLAGRRETLISQDKLYRDSKYLGDLLSVEVAKDLFPSKEAFLSQLENFKEIGIYVNNNGLCEIKETEITDFISGLWRPLLTSYWVVYFYLLECCTEGTEYTPDTLIHSCQEFALSLFLKGIVAYLEIQSLELLRNGLKSLQKLDIVKQLNHGSKKQIVIINKEALYNLAVSLESFLQLTYDHLTSLTSKL